MSLLWILFVIYFSCLSLLCCIVCSLQPNGHLLEMCVVFSCILVNFPYGVLDQVWYLIVSITNLCFSLYFYSFLFPVFTKQDIKLFSHSSPSHHPRLYNKPFFGLAFYMPPWMKSGPYHTLKTGFVTRRKISRTKLIPP